MEFKERVEVFWNNFQQRHEEFEQILALNNYKYVIDEIWEMSSDIDTILSVDVSKNQDGTYDLLILGDSRLKSYLNLYITTFNPANLFAKWNFYYATPPSQVSGGFSNEDNIYAKVLVENEIDVVVVVYNDNSIKEDMNIEHIESILIHYLGDILFHSVISEIRFENSKSEDLILLKDIRNTMLDLQEMGIIEYIDNPFYFQSEYEMHVEDFNFIREDIAKWISVVNQPYDAYFNLDEDFFYSYEKSGVTFGSVFMDYEQFITNQEESSKLIGGILDILKKNQAALYMGTSMGLEYIYFDLIILHKTEFIDALTYEASEFENFEIYFATFNNETEIIQVN